MSEENDLNPVENEEDTKNAVSKVDDVYKFIQEVEELDTEYEQEILQRQEKREILHKKRRRRNSVIFSCIGGIAAIAVITIIILTFTVFYNPLINELTVEAGSEVRAEEFAKNQKEGQIIEFSSDMTQEVTTDHIGEYSVAVDVNGKTYESKLIVEDTVAPDGTAKSVNLNMGGEIAPEDLVENISDATDVVCSYREDPDYTEEGIVRPVIVLTDEAENTTEVTASVTVIFDDEAPVIDGVAHINATIGVPVAYRSNITVTDNCDEDVTVEVDTSLVNEEEEGTYTVVYTATDRAGNTSSEETTITFAAKSANYVEEEVVLAEAQEVLDGIITDEMTLKQKAKAIYDWVRSNVAYVSSSEKDSWTYAAHQGFTVGSGDCYVFFATSKALLTQAGIPNIDVEKSNVTRSHHYWSLVNVGDGWYHFASTPRQSGSTFFLATDAEMIGYFESHGTYNPFDTSLYPATPTTPSTIE